MVLFWSKDQKKKNHQCSCHIKIEHSNNGLETENLPDETYNKMQCPVEKPKEPSPRCEHSNVNEESPKLDSSDLSEEAIKLKISRLAEMLKRYELVGKVKEELIKIINSGANSFTILNPKFYDELSNDELMLIFAGLKAGKIITFSGRHIGISAAAKTNNTDDNNFSSARH